MQLAGAAPIGLGGAVLQATKALAAVTAKARGMNRKGVMTVSWGLSNVGTNLRQLHVDVYVATGGLEPSSVH